MSNDFYGIFFHFLSIWSRLSHLNLATYTRQRNKTQHLSQQSVQKALRQWNCKVQMMKWVSRKKCNFVTSIFLIILRSGISFFFKTFSGENSSSKKPGNIKTRYANIPRYILMIMCQKFRDSWHPIFVHASHLTADVSSVKTHLKKASGVSFLWPNTDVFLWDAYTWLLW